MIELNNIRGTLSRIASAESEVFSSKLLKSDHLLFHQVAELIRNFRYGMQASGSMHYLQGYIAALPFLDKEKDKIKISEYKSKVKGLVQHQFRCDKQIFDNHLDYLRSQLASQMMNDLSSFESAIIVVERISAWEYEITTLIEGNLRISDKIQENH